MRKNITISRLVTGALTLVVLGGATLAHAQYTTMSTLATQASFAFLSMPSDLSVTSTGTQVASLQGLLSELGYLNIPRGVATGYFGNLTQAALMSYQRSLGVVPTGVFDSPTREASKGYLSRVYPGIAQLVSVNNPPLSQMPPSSTAPLGTTGYWYNGNWYSSIPPMGTTTIAQGIAGYWYNGVWYQTNVGTNGSTNTTNMNITVVPTGQAAPDSAVRPVTGYWYRGAWYDGSVSGNVATEIDGFWSGGKWYPLR